VIWLAVAAKHQLINTDYNIARNDKFCAKLNDSFYCKQVCQSITHKAFVLIYRFLDPVIYYYCFSHFIYTVLFYLVFFFAKNLLLNEDPGYGKFVKHNFKNFHRRMFGPAALPTDF
jgi:hypothetical protein